MIETGLECRLSAQLHTQRHKRCEKRHFLRHLYLKTNISPRQARDKHRESTQKQMCRFVQESTLITTTATRSRCVNASPSSHTWPVRDNGRLLFTSSINSLSESFPHFGPEPVLANGCSAEPISKVKNMSCFYTFLRREQAQNGGPGALPEQQPDHCGGLLAPVSHRRV